MGKFNKRESNKGGRNSHTGTDIETDRHRDRHRLRHKNRHRDRLLQKGMDSDSSCNRQRREDREHVENANLEMTPNGSAFISFLNATLKQYW